MAETQENSDGLPKVDPQPNPVKFGAIEESTRFRTLGQMQKPAAPNYKGWNIRSDLDLCKRRLNILSSDLNRVLARSEEDRRKPGYVASVAENLLNGCSTGYCNELQPGTTKNLALRAVHESFREAREILNRLIKANDLSDLQEFLGALDKCQTALSTAYVQGFSE